MATADTMAASTVAAHTGIAAASIMEAFTVAIDADIAFAADAERRAQLASGLFLMAKT